MGVHGLQRNAYPKVVASVNGKCSDAHLVVCERGVLNNAGVRGGRCCAPGGRSRGGRVVASASVGDLHH